MGKKCLAEANDKSQIMLRHHLALNDLFSNASCIQDDHWAIGDLAWVLSHEHDELLNLGLVPNLRYVFRAVADYIIEEMRQQVEDFHVDFALAFIDQKVMMRQPVESNQDRRLVFLEVKEWRIQDEYRDLFVHHWQGNEYPESFKLQKVLLLISDISVEYVNDNLYYLRIIQNPR